MGMGEGGGRRFGLEGLLSWGLYDGRGGGGFG